MWRRHSCAFPPDGGCGGGGGGGHEGLGIIGELAFAKRAGDDGAAGFVPWIRLAPTMRCDELGAAGVEDGGGTIVHGGVDEAGDVNVVSHGRFRVSGFWFRVLGGDSVWRFALWLDEEIFGLDDAAADLGEFRIR